MPTHSHLQQDVFDTPARFHMGQLCAPACVVTHTFRFSRPQHPPSEATGFDGMRLALFREAYQSYAHGPRIEQSMSSRPPWRARFLPNQTIPERSSTTHPPAKGPLGTEHAERRQSSDVCPKETSLSYSDKRAGLLWRLLPVFLRNVRGYRDSCEIGVLDSLSVLACPTNNARYIEGSCSRTIQQGALAKENELEAILISAQHIEHDIRDCIDDRAFEKESAASFFTTYPTKCPVVYNVHWAMIQQGHLGEPVSTDSTLFKCQHCSKAMNVLVALGDNVANFWAFAFGRTYRQNAVRNSHPHVACPTTASSGRHSLPRTRLRPANILIHTEDTSNSPASRCLSCALTTVPASHSHTCRRSLTRQGAIPDIANKARIRDLQRKHVNRLPHRQYAM